MSIYEFPFGAEHPFWNGVFFCLAFYIVIVGGFFLGKVH